MMTPTASPPIDTNAVEWLFSFVLMVGIAVWGVLRYTLSRDERVLEQAIGRDDKILEQAMDAVAELRKEVNAERHEEAVRTAEILKQINTRMEATDARQEQRTSDLGKKLDTKFDSLMIELMKHRGAKD